MKLSFRPTSRAEAPRVRAFLGETFRTDADASFLDEAQIDWKYYAPHPHWEGSRSFVYDGEQGIAAHACGWPIRLLTQEGRIDAVHPIDWAASSRIPGVGALLLREMRGLRDVSFCIGGTPIARQVIARTGYRPFAGLDFHARPLRPVRQALTHQRKDWTLAPRLARNVAWTVGSSPSVPAGWRARPIEPRELPDEVLPRARPGVAVALRTRELFEYFRGCPVARHQLFLVEDGGTPIGYFLLSFTPGEARVCDAALGNLAAPWSGLYGLAVRAALEEGSAAEISAACSLGVLAEALAACGFRSRRVLPVMLFDRAGRLASTPEVHLQMIDGDFSFLHENHPEYQT